MSTIEVDGNGSRQRSRQIPKKANLSTQFFEKPKKSPRLRSDFSWLGWRDSNPRMLEPELGTEAQTTTYETRATEVRQFMRARTRQWILGAVAVNLAVK
jgi:hypothetical protein